MSPLQRQQMISGLILLVIALFVASSYPPAARWRRQIRVATIALFCVAAALVLVEIALWVGIGH